MHHASHLAGLAPFVLFVLFCYWAGQPSSSPSRSADRRDEDR
jgi:hypothetical protein